jgi:hypothetical protein
MNILYKNLGQYTDQNEKLSLDKAMISWHGRMKFRTYNPGKIIKYGELVRMVCEAVSSYIRNIELYSAEGKKLDDSVITFRPKLRPKSLHLSRQFL